MPRQTRLLVVSLLSVGLHAALVGLVPWDADLVESVYAERFYPAVGPLVAWLPSLLPFSLINAVFLTLAVGLPVCWIVNLLRWRRGRLGGWQAVERSLLAIALPGAVLFHTFYIFWGYHYLRPPLEQRLGLELAAVSGDQRAAFSRRFVGEAVAARVEVGDWDRAELDALVDAALAEVVPLLEGRPTPVVSPLKGDLNTGLLSWLDVSGFVFGSTLEAHVDFNLPGFALPFTAAHEKAHLAGFARERDANFVAWLALTRADDARLRYAGYFGVIGFFLNGETRALAGPILADRARLLAYNAASSAPAPLRQGGQRVYGAYLRANRMPTGLGDYAEVWQLIQAWTLERP